MGRRTRRDPKADPGQRSRQGTQTRSAAFAGEQGSGGSGLGRNPGTGRKRRGSMKGKVYLVGAGPGDPELLTLKALRVLKTAEAVLHDDLVSPEILRLIPSSAQVHNVGKRCGKKNIQQEEINFLMIALADSGLRVVRLKSGDPLIFGRAGEEIEALRKANIEFEIVPGITAALGAAANAQIPLTHRQVASAIVVVTGHRAGSDEFADWPANIPTDATVVVYMPGYEYGST